MHYFDQNVLDALADEDTLLSTSEQAAYMHVCDGIKKIKKPIKTKKKPDVLRRFAIWHIPDLDNNGVLTHWILLPGKTNWDTQHQNIVAKLAVNIVTGEKLFLKIRRPSDDFTDTTHIKAARSEAENHLSLNMPTVYAERNTLHGYKAYVFQNYGGKVNLFNMIEKFETSPREIVALLIAAGNALKEIHAQGFIHCDFKLQNVAYNKYARTVTIVDLEHLLRISEGEKGIDRLCGTHLYSHPEWLFDAAYKLSKGKPVNYSIQNDVHAFIVSAYYALEEACLRYESPHYQKQLLIAKDQLEAWTREIFRRLPTMDTVLAVLKKIQLQPEQDLSEQMEALSLKKHKKRI